MCNVYNCVYSIKGGCGKTAFSIKLAKFFCAQSSENPQTCLIDLDMTGSSLWNIFYSLSNLAEIPKNAVYINDIAHGDNANRQYMKKISEMQTSRKTMNSLDETSGRAKISDFYVAFASPQIEDIKKYRVNQENNYTPYVPYDAFAVNFGHFLNDNVQMKRMQQVIFDMPPGADGFSNIVYEMMFGNHSQYRNNVRNLYYVMDYDAGHLLALEREMVRWFEVYETALPDNIVIVINDQTGMGVSKEPDRQAFVEALLETRINDIVEKLQKNISKLPEGVIKRIHIVKMDFDELYSTTIIEGQGLINTNFFEGCEWGCDYKYTIQADLTCHKLGDIAKVLGERRNV